jgi:hypothetical protein
VGNVSSARNVLPQSYSVQIDVMLSSCSIIRTNKSDGICTRSTETSCHFSGFISVRCSLQKDAVGSSDNTGTSGTVSE